MPRPDLPLVLVVPLDWDPDQEWRPLVVELMDRSAGWTVDGRVADRYVYLLPVGWTGHPADAAVASMGPGASAPPGS